MLTVYHCDSNRTSHHPPRIIRGGFFHPFLLPPSHGQPTTASTSRDDSLVCRSVCQQPTTANEGQRRPMKAHSSQRRPPEANAGPRKPTAANAGQRRPTKAHGSPRQPTKANDSPQQPTQVHEGPQQPMKANEDKKGPNDARWRRLGPRYVFFFILLLLFLLLRDSGHPTRTRTPRNPYPGTRVRVFWGTGTGSPGKPQGYPCQSLVARN